MGSNEQDKRKRVMLRFLKPNGDCIRGLEIDEPFDNNFKFQLCSPFKVLC